MKFMQILGITALTLVSALISPSCAIVGKVTEEVGKATGNSTMKTAGKSTQSVAKVADKCEAKQAKEEAKAKKEAEKSNKDDSATTTASASTDQPEHDEVEAWGEASETTLGLKTKYPQREKYENNVAAIENAKVFRDQEAMIEINGDSTGNELIKIDRTKQGAIVQYTGEQLTAAQATAKSISDKVKANPTKHGYKSSEIKNAGLAVKWWQRRYNDQVRVLANVNSAYQKAGGKLEIIVFPNDPEITQRVSNMSLGIELAAALPAEATTPNSDGQVASTTPQSPK